MSSKPHMAPQKLVSAVSALENFWCVSFASSTIVGKVTARKVGTMMDFLCSSAESFSRDTPMFTRPLHRSYDPELY